MSLIKLRKSSHNAVTWWIAFIISSLPVLISCGESHESPAESALPNDTESFTFFGLGKKTKLTKMVRRNLADKLGRDAIERRSILDLEINYQGFIKKYLPELETVNQKLNFPPRERVEHNTVKLMYRYAQKKNMPFNLVELVFSDYTKTPVLFKIYFKIDEANTLNTLKEKYGQPQVIEWKEENGRSMFWKKNNDFLILSFMPNQFGTYDHQIVIYYIDSLNQLMATERKEKLVKEQQRAKKGENAF